MKATINKIIANPIIVILTIICTLFGVSVFDISKKIFGANMSTYTISMINLFVKLVLIFGVWYTYRQLVKKETEIELLKTEQTKIKADQLTTDTSFFKLNHDIAGFMLYYQANQSLLIKDYKMAYTNFILSVKYAIESTNIGNIPSALKMIKDQILPNFSKDDIDMLKKDKFLDIEDMFKHIASIDKDKVFALTIQEIRAIINRLPQTITSQ